MKHRFFHGVLTLCFVALALSVGVSAKASQSFRKVEDYTDSQRIQYREAVAVISAIQVMDGYTDGSFRPGGYLTRGAASKIVANLAITPGDEGWYKQVIQKDPFVDVSKEHVFGTHIAYCFQENLISGYGNHTFRPADNLTYNAFLKMLLCVLGHDQYGEGYTGEGWAQRVQTDARNNGLLMGLRESFDGGAFISREVAALFAFNALQANQVDYSDGVPKPRVVDLSASKYKNIRDATVRYGNGQPANQIVQFAEERFPELRRLLLPSAYGDYVTLTWQLNGDKGWEDIISYSELNPFLSYNVLFDRNDESNVPGGEPVSVTNGSVYGALPSGLTRSGYGFAGWFTLPDGGEKITDFSPVWLDADITLYAHWTMGRYYVYFNGNGGSVSRDSMEIPTSGALHGLPTPSRNGYSFTGWYTDAQGGEQIQNGDRISPSASMTLYAHWRARQYWVTFSARGATVTPSRITVRPGEMYGRLPEMGIRNDVPFSGWYTEPDGQGQKIEETTPVDLDDDQTLYAYWGEEVYDNICSLTFYVDDLTHAVIRIARGESLTEWPAEPQMQNFEFTGWVESVSQKVPELPLVVNTNLVFTASYDVLRNHTVAFHAEGVDDAKIPPPLVKNPGEQLWEEELPTLELDSTDSRRFLGWSYNGVLLDSFPLTVTRNMDLYAKWVNPLSISDFSYGFDNSATEKGFRYPAGFDKKIFIPRYQLIFGNNALAKQIYQYDIQQNGFEWPGNCFGMSTTAGMFQYPGNNIHIAAFDDPERRLSKPLDISVPTEPLREFIEAMQVSQKTILVVKTYWENIGSLNGLCEEVSRFSDTGGGAVVICIYKDNDEGHALLGYYLEERDEHTSYVRVYDSNYPGELHYLVLRKDDSGNYTSWYYDYARTSNNALTEMEAEGTVIRWGSDYGGRITYIPYETYFRVWQRRGNQDISMNLLTTNLTDATIYDSEGNKIASFRGGEIENPDDIRRNGLYPLVNVDENPSNASLTIAVWLPDGSEYRIVNDAPNQIEQTVALSNTERSVSVTTRARVVTLSVDTTHTDAENQRHFTPRVAVEGADENLIVRADNISLPQRVDAPALTNQAVIWSGAVTSEMELALDLLYDGTLTSLRSVSDGTTDSLLVGTENMTERLNNSPGGVISFEDTSG